MDHGIERFECCRGVGALERSICGGLELGEDVFVFPLSVLLGGFESFPKEFLGQSEKRLVL